jgi:hypothetical protein
MMSTKHCNFLRLILSLMALNSLFSFIVAKPVANAELSVVEDRSADPLPVPLLEPALGISFDEGATESVALPASLNLLKRQGKSISPVRNPNHENVTDLGVLKQLALLGVQSTLATLNSTSPNLMSVMQDQSFPKPIMSTFMLTRQRHGTSGRLL